MFKILLVCAANVCRSPAAAAVLRTRLAAQIEAGHYDVRSGGLRAEPGRPACAAMIATLTGYGADSVTMRGHRSKQAAPSDLRWADVVLTAERGQRAEIIAFDPALRGRTFTMREAARLMGALSPTDGADRLGFGGEDPAGLVARMNDLRGDVTAGSDASLAGLGARWRRRLLGRPSAHPDDILDPHEWYRVPHSDCGLALVSAIDVLAPQPVAPVRPRP